MIFSFISNVNQKDFHKKNKNYFLSSYCCVEVKAWDRQYARDKSPTNPIRNSKLLTTERQLCIWFLEKNCLHLINWNGNVASSITAENQNSYPIRIVFTVTPLLKVFRKKYCLKANDVRQKAKSHFVQTEYFMRKTTRELVGRDRRGELLWTQNFLPFSVPALNSRS